MPSKKETAFPSVPTPTKMVKAIKAGVAAISPGDFAGPPKTPVGPAWLGPAVSFAKGAMHELSPPVSLVPPHPTVTLKPETLHGAMSPLASKPAPQWQTSGILKGPMHFSSAAEQKKQATQQAAAKVAAVMAMYSMGALLFSPVQNPRKKSPHIDELD